MKLSDELAFLPAVLEIQESPPLPASRYILWAIVLFFSIAVVWACVGKVNIVGVAQGKIVPSGRVKIIQPLETGVVRTIFVEQGEHVALGQPLVELDTTLTGADRDQIREQQLALKLDRARLLSIIETLNSLPAANDRGTEANYNHPVTNNYFAETTQATPTQISLQKQRINSQLNDFHAQQAALQDEQHQRTAERGAIVQRIEQLDATIPLITERTESLKNLLGNNLVPRVDYLELEQQRIEQVKEREVQKNNLTSIYAAIANIKQRLTAQKAEFMSQLLTDLTDAENRITAFDQELIKADKRVTLQLLKSPVTGFVHQLAVHTVGGVVTPAQELMHIVPDKDAFEIEAWIQNRDIGFVHDGQKAKIKVETFQFTKYGTIGGEVVNVSNDATPDERLGLVYAARVKMDRTTMKVEDKIVNLSPGMAVTVEVNMGKRRLIEYLMSPLLKYKDESLREK
jgi:hemolysin D